jgi:hypothetical protein
MKNINNNLQELQKTDQWERNKILPNNNQNGKFTKHETNYLKYSHDKSQQ